MTNFGLTDPHGDDGSLDNVFGKEFCLIRCEEIKGNDLQHLYDFYITDIYFQLYFIANETDLSKDERMFVC